MPIRISCPSCGRTGRVPEHAIGRSVQCPACKHRYLLTTASAIPEGLELIDDPPPDSRPKPPSKPSARRIESPPEPALDDPYAYAEASSPTRSHREPNSSKVSRVVLVGGVALLLLALVTTVLVSGSRPGDASSSSAKPVVAAVTVPKVIALAPAAPGKALSTAEIVAESDPSIALIRGKSSSGTGFLVSPGLLATNAHVINDEFVSNLEIRFPSAEGPRKGPFRGELLYEDPRRDLAFLSVKTDLPALRVADSYTFRKGEAITVIGSPGLDDGVVLENAISQGVMSTRATLDGQSFYQLGIAVNPGNSGGPVLDSSGRVIGVVTLKTEKQESLAFCVPVEDLRAALSKLQRQAESETARLQSRHRVVHAVKGLGTGGALYCLGINLRRALSSGALSDSDQRQAAETFPKTLAEIDKVFLSTLMPEVPAIRADSQVAEPVRGKVVEIADNYQRLKTLYDGHETLSFHDLGALKGTHRRLIVELSKDLGLDVPESMLVVFNDIGPAQSEPGYALDGFGSIRRRMPPRPGMIGPRPPGFGSPRHPFPTRPRIGPRR